MPETQSTQTVPDQSPLDEVMLAMDIVDTLRHEQSQVEAELNEEARERALVARVRKIYEQQGIEVPEAVVAEGVLAMKRERLVFRPPPRSWKVRAAEMWVDRRRWILLMVTAGAIALGIGWISGREERARTRREAIESQANAASATQNRAEIESILLRHGGPTPPNITDRALVERRELLLREAQGGLASGDLDRAKSRAHELRSLDLFVSAELELKIVAHASATSGVERTSREDRNVQLYYLIVESRDHRGSPWPIDVQDEASGERKASAVFGIRVPKAVYDRVKADKLDNRIVDDALVGQKLPGQGKIRWLVDFEGGMILQW